MAPACDYDWEPVGEPCAARGKFDFGTPTKNKGRSSRSKGLTNLTHYYSCKRVNNDDELEETFTIGDAVVISEQAAKDGRIVSQYLVTSKYNSTSPSKRTSPSKKRKRDDDVRHGLEDDLDHNQVVGLIIDIYTNEREQLRVKLHWLFRPKVALMLWDQGTFEDYVQQHNLKVEHNELFYASELDRNEEDDLDIPPSLRSPTKSASQSTSERRSKHEDDLSPDYILRKVVCTSKISDIKSSPADTFLVRRFWNSNPGDDDDWLQLFRFDDLRKEALQTGWWDLETDTKGSALQRSKSQSLKKNKGPQKEQDTPTRSRVITSAPRNDILTVKESKTSRTMDDILSSSSESEDEENPDDKDFGRAEDTDQARSDSEDEISAATSSESEAVLSEAEDDDFSASRRKSTAGRNVARRSAAAGSSRHAIRSDIAKATKIAKQKRRAQRQAKRKDRQSDRMLESKRLTSFQALKDNTSLDPFKKARALLHVSVTPDVLPCREVEFGEIELHLEDAIDEGNGCCVYVAGVPGTGKTATVRSVIQALQARVKEGTLNPFEFLEINGMKLTEPSQAFVELWNFVGPADQRIRSPKTALTNLENYFKIPTPGRKTRVVLLDELDQLVTANKRNDVIYNFFNWPNQAHSKLVVIAISNALDLPEQMSQKIRSRLGGNRVNYTPYEKSDLVQILKGRLDGLDIFANDTIGFISATVAKITGDARRALDIMRRTVENVETFNATETAAGRSPRKISVKDAQAVCSAVAKAGSGSYIAGASLHQKIMMLAISREVKKKGTEDVAFSDVINFHLGFLRQAAIQPVPTQAQLFQILSSLAALKLVTTESSRLDHFQRVRMDIKGDDLMMALREDPTLERHLARF